MTTGVGSAFGAITLLNATATGRGCSLAVAADMRATWTWRNLPGIQFEGPPGVDDRLAQAVAHRVRQQFGLPFTGATIATETTTPPARGLKTSSSAAAAMVRAAANAASVAIHRNDVVRLAVAASRDAGVTLTGALDDQCAVTLGGCQWTDNLRMRRRARLPSPAYAVAIWVPEASTRKRELRGLNLDAAVAGAWLAEDALRRGDLPAALRENHDAYAPVYAAAGLATSRPAVDAALDAGALAAGLSGTGPAVAALFTPEAATTPRHVPGGAWMRTTVEAPR